MIGNNINNQVISEITRQNENNIANGSNDNESIYYEAAETFEVAQNVQSKLKENDNSIIKKKKTEKADSSEKKFAIPLHKISIWSSRQTDYKTDHSYPPSNLNSNCHGGKKANSLNDSGCAPNSNMIGIGSNTNLESIEDDRNEQPLNNIKEENLQEEKLDTIYETIPVNSLPSMEKNENNRISIPNKEINLSLNDSSNPLNSRFSKLRISEVTFNLKEEVLDINFWKKNLRNILVKSKQMSPEHRHFKNLLELQNFQVDYHQIWVMKISENGKYLATGDKKGTLTIYEIMSYDYEHYKDSYQLDNIFSYLSFLDETPYRVYTEHSSDISDISWSSKNYNCLLTASLDHFVILWNINSDAAVMKYEHDHMVSCVYFCPSGTKDDELFVSGCLDKYVRIWNIKNTQRPEYFNIKEKITSIAYLPTGDSIAIGTHNAKIIIYDCKPHPRYNCSFTCKNRMGKYSMGKKVTNIEFINRTCAYITTSDSRIRLVSFPDGKQLQKYKGHLNEDSMIRAHSDDTYDLLISASEDGFCYVWNKYNKESSNKKNYSYECFKPYSKDVILNSIFVSEQCKTQYLKKVFHILTNVFIYSIIINTTATGRLQVLINIEESNA